MRAPVSWIKQYCPTELSPTQIAERFDLTGTEVASVLAHGVTQPEGFVVGEVLTCEQHPDADRLRVCTVAVGVEEPSTIVCGAPNVAAGQKVPVVLPGSVLPDGSKLKPAKLRGVRSEGMILAADELSLGDDHSGVIVFTGADAERPAGTPLSELFELGGPVLELEVTPNRPDCLGMYGVARELAAATGTELAPPPWSEDPLATGSTDAAQTPLEISVKVECPDLCPRFTARGFENVTVGPSPWWLRAKLAAAGQRSISNVVDITNYVMLETGQPLHAFDADLIDGKELLIRLAREGERVATLDGEERQVDAHTVLVCDAKGPTAIAGIMGGARSEVSESTNNVLLEVANWDGPNIHRSSLNLGLRSEASSRFEKGLSPASVMDAQALATRLMVELCGATPVPETADVGGAPAPAAAISLRAARIEAVLGYSVSRDRAAEILVLLGFAVDTDGGELSVVPPYFRAAEVTREIDLIEEIARIEGLDKLPATLPPRIQAGGLGTTQVLRRKAEDALAAAGLSEIAGWTFTTPDLPGKLGIAEGDHGSQLVSIANPMSETESVLRGSLLGSLLDAASHNRTRGAERIGLFELGAVHLQHGDITDAPERITLGDSSTALDERLHAGAIVSGTLRSATWREQAPPAVDFFAAKSLLEQLARALRVPLRYEAEQHPFTAPGQSAIVIVGERQVGWIGQLHPSVTRAWQLPESYAFEVDLDKLFAAAKRLVKYEAISDQPPLVQDIAVVVGTNVTADQLLHSAATAGGELLDGVEIFDIFSGEALGSDMVSVGLRLTFRASDRTLTDSEVAPLRTKILDQLASEFGAVARA